jgi:hypothetical protein
MLQILLQSSQSYIRSDAILESLGMRINKFFSNLLEGQ